MENWIIGIILALFVIVPCWLALLRRRETERQVLAWSELAQRTGLVMEPNIFNFPKNYHRPGLRGEYRGRCLLMYLVLSGDTDSNQPVLYQNTLISLDVRNPAEFSLSIRAKSLHNYIHETAEVSSANTDFDRRFSAMGSPRAYLQGALALIVRSDPWLLAWIMRKFPSIELKGGKLVCNQNAELIDVEQQFALVNLLCDLAELAENMGVPVAVNAQESP